ncbi:MAG TPA: hypothetical protein VKU92_06695, partial [Acidimicrobiales bacterium]|nr:hypothetical protein [Acidimicrobiales bacterium]
MLAVISSLLVMLAARTLYVQGPKASAYAAYGRSEQYETVTLPADRGTVYDRNGNVVAISVPRVDVIADDFLIHSASGASAGARALAPVLHLPVASLVRKLTERSGYIPIAMDVSQAAAARVESLGLPFLAFVPDQVRQDPAGSLFQPLLGVVGWGGRGLSGIEYLYQRALAGRSGEERVLVGAAGEQLPGGGQVLHEAV